ncbi:MAG: SAM-dependent methyltransferase [Acidobacteria bacterium]|nr:MAG: SAM-dependent methyltransferase [Acidobacteriota bacterium]
MTDVDLPALLNRALKRRLPLLKQWHGEGTDCYRLFHGTAEGLPGVTVDRYGPQLIIQTFHHSLEAENLAQIQNVVNAQLGSQCGAEESHKEAQRGTKREVMFPEEPLTSFYVDRSGKGAQTVTLGEPAGTDNDAICHELGVQYRTRGRHRGQDPLLFLDLRAGRRWIQREAKGLSVLNLFAYTCGMGICASHAGATEVVNVDFSQSALSVGSENASLNGIGAGISFIQSDIFPALRQLAGLPVTFRRRRGVPAPGNYPRLEPRQFDLVVLDPPRWAKSPFGTVDLIRDYPSVFKPALLATAPGGWLLCTNNVAQVGREDWLDQLRRSAAKAGRPIKAVELIEPEADFPSFDGRPPLKMAVLEV